ncbi:hypothetical protein BESB_068060 [Besnoitia besnoiti]|uniref:RNA methyltransferase n=1 Tax=Besnoitia besnoiti TaxID=94643 RepID=A0A2A9MGJ2_BESBE|nr:hypothetical protein BESB_068060 [Besnoitia besnoiti]PFH34773.1 hypothetical protein BESB_068060 [Besnoitia besnoiti]
MGPPAQSGSCKSQLVPSSWFVTSPCSSSAGAVEKSAKERPAAKRQEGRRDDGAESGGKRQGMTGSQEKKNPGGKAAAQWPPQDAAEKFRGRRDPGHPKGAPGRTLNGAFAKSARSASGESRRHSDISEKPAHAASFTWRKSGLFSGSDNRRGRFQGKNAKLYERERSTLRKAHAAGGVAGGEPSEDEGEVDVSVGADERKKMKAAAMAAISGALNEQQVLSDLEDARKKGKDIPFSRDAKRKRADSAFRRGSDIEICSGETKRLKTEKAKKNHAEDAGTKETGGRAKDSQSSPARPAEEDKGKEEEGEISQRVRTEADDEDDDEDDGADDEFQLHIVKRPVAQDKAGTRKPLDLASSDRRHEDSSGPRAQAKGRERAHWREAQSDQRGSRASGAGWKDSRYSSPAFDVAVGEKRFFPPLGAAPKQAETETGSDASDAEVENGNPKTDREKETGELLRFIPKTLPFAGARRTRTLSIALPASIVDNAQTLELRAALVGHIARTLTVFGVDEIVIYEDVAASISRGAKGGEGHSRALEFFVRNLRYLETPQFLRKALFPIHPDLRFAGLQNPLDAPHHLRRNEWLPYREGVVVASSKSRESGKQGSSVEGEHTKGFEEEVKLSAAQEKKLKAQQGAWVECGLPRHVWIPGDRLEGGMRVTVRLEPSVRHLQRQPPLEGSGADGPLMRGVAVSPDEPPVKAGLYWGYRVRIAQHFKDVFSHCPFSSDGRYDLTVGTSERGTRVGRDFKLPANYKHMLLVFGGLQGLEAVLLDRQSNCAPSRDPSTLFDLYLNTCAFQRSRTIRAEEAVPITLALLRPYLLEQDELSE